MNDSNSKPMSVEEWAAQQMSQPYRGIELDLAVALRAIRILKHPMTALEFADAFWPDRINDRRRSRSKPGSRSRAGHALLHALTARGIVCRSDNGDSKSATFAVVFPSS